MTSRFDAVGIDADTKILFQSEAEINGYAVLFQKWYWEGISAESIIFVSEDIQNCDEDALKKMVSDVGILENGSSITIKKTDNGFTFVNFNFESN